jgi:hypothetical protein
MMMSGDHASLVAMSIERQHSDGGDRVGQYLELLQTRTCLDLEDDLEALHVPSS